MFSEPDGRRLLLAAATTFGYHASPDVDLIWGLGRRTVSGPVRCNDDDRIAWLRLVAAKTPGGKLWNGTGDAEDLFADAVPRPRLLGVDETSHQGMAVRAELLTYVSARVISPTPNLTPGSIAAKLSDQWWEHLRDAVRTLTVTPAPTQRESVVSAAFVKRTIRRYLDIDVDPASVPWTLAHGDLHWANLTESPLTILDWEGFGPAPVGFDAANLYAYSLPDSAVARRVRTVFGDELGGPSGRLAELLVAVIILQAAERDPIHARLAPAVRQHVTGLLRM